MHGAAARARLAAMGIDVWLLRSSTDAREDEAGTAPWPMTRIRLESGTGSWLILADEVERTTYRVLLDDIRTVLGPAECRFGKWSDTPEAGIGPEDWSEHGIRHVLAFGHVPQDSGVLLRAAALPELAVQAGARKALWALLRPSLDD